MKQIMKEITTNDNKKIYRCSRWIKIKHNYNPNKRNSLYYYTVDGYGYREGTENYNPIEHDGKYIDYFCWNGRKWAVEQFLKLDYPIFYEENDKLCYLSGYDSEEYYNPILIECDEYYEHVRVYTERKFTK